MNPERKEAWHLVQKFVRPNGTDSGAFYDRKRIAMTLAPILAVPHNVVLEVGSGSGEATQCLQFAKGVKLAVGVDSDRRALLKCAQSGNPASFVQADGDEGLPFRAESIDCLLAAEVYEHLHHPDDFLEETRRILRPNGLLVLTTPNTEALVLMFLRVIPRAWARRILLRGGSRQRSLHPEFFGVPASEDGHSHQREGSSLREMDGLATNYGFRLVHGTTWGMPFATDPVLNKLPHPLWRFMLDRFHTLRVGFRHVMVVWVRIP